MKYEVSNYYKQKGYNKLYVAINKEPRKVATLRKPDGKMISMSYAKYLYTSHYECDIEKGIQVDHINNDKMDDRIENLQLLTQAENIRKSHKKEALVELKCPVCGKSFLYKKRNLSSHPNPCCSRRCGGIKSHIKKL